MILKGLPLERAIESPLGDLFHLLLQIHGDKVLQVDAITSKELSAHTLLTQSKLLANWLKREGIQIGDIIGISSENRLEFAIIVIALFFLGATIAPVNHEYTPNELKLVLNLSKPKLLFVSSKYYKKFQSLLPDHSYLKQLILIGEDVEGSLQAITLQSILQDAQLSLDFELPLLDPKETVAVILCSSGTTGLPKGVMITHDNITTFVEISRLILGNTVIVGDEVNTALVPFFHSMGFMMMCVSILGGQKVVVYPRFSSKLFLESISKFKVTTIIAPPLIANFLLKNPLVDQYDLSTVRIMRSGAAAIGIHTQQQVKEKFHLNTISQAYGMTETTLGVLLHPADAPRMGSVGKVAPGMEAKVIGEDGNSLGPDQEGELCFRGPLIMKGYLGDPKATANAIDPDGWLHTGDVGYYTSDGYFYIVDRIKELIKYKGFQVAPAELEELLATHPDVVDVAVVGLEQEDVGELPVAYIVKKAGSNVNDKELKDYVASKVSSYKQLRGGVIFTNHIPRNMSGKILRRKLRKQLSHL